MELSKSIDSKWRDKFAIREVWFQPPQVRFLFFVEATVYVLGVRQDHEDKQKSLKSVPLEIPFRLIEVEELAMGGKPMLIIYRQSVSGKMMDTFSSGDYSREEIVRAVFSLPPDMKLLVSAKAEEQKVSCHQ